MKTENCILWTELAFGNHEKYNNIKENDQSSPERATF
jgi:hypothetical protein